jgi:hypothetical protein
MKRVLLWTTIVFGTMFSSVCPGYSGWIAGKTGNALSFDGLDDYVEIMGYKGITGTQSRTCCAWIKTITTQQSVILSWGADQNGQKWTFRVESNGTLGVGVWGGYITTTAKVNDGLWHHVAAVLNDDGSPSVNEILLYIDGVLQSTTASSTQTVGTIASQDVILGAFKNAGVTAAYFNGVLDEVCLYDRALGSNELNLQGSIPTDGLVARWAMDETEGFVAHNTVSSYDGLLRNMSKGYSGGSGTAADPYKIATKVDLLALAGTLADYNKYFILTADVDLEGVVFTKAIIAPNTISSSNFQGTAFTGKFNGNGHKITNFTINGGNNSYLGLFGYIGRGGQVQYLGIENYVISSGGSYIGGLTGINYIGTITQCYSTGTVNGSGYVGGLAGYNQSANSSLGVITSCYATGSVKGSYSVGGLVGENWGSISQCYSASTVGGTSSYSNIGGLVGGGSSDSVKNSFWDIQTSGQTKSRGGTGKTTAEMKTQTTFAGFGWFAGNTGNALYFDGKSAYVKTPTYYGIGGSGARTVSMWIKPVASDHDQTLIQWGADKTGQLWLLCLLADGTVKVAAYDGGVQSSKPISFNQWHHIVVTLREGQPDSGQICLYIDGQSQAVALANHCTINTSQNVPVHLGVWYKSSTGSLLNYFYGLMDDVCIYNRALDESEIAPVYYADGLVNHWKFDESMGNTANDSAGSQNGELHNMTVSGWISGRTGNALVFDGIDDYMDVPEHYGIGGTSARTVSVWIKAAATGKPQTLVQWGSDTNGQLWMLRLDTIGTISAAVSYGNVQSTRTVTDNQWHYIAAVLDEGQTESSRIRLYIDGQPETVIVNGSTAIHTAQTVPIHIGVCKLYSTGGKTNYFQGMMDDVCIYDRALDGSEIAPVYYADGLVNHWKFDESMGNTASDSAGSQNGVLRNMTDTSWVYGRTGKALAFNGIDDYVEVPGYKGILGTQSRTCCAWIKTTTTQQGVILSWGADQNGQKWTFRVESNGTLGVGVWGGYINSTATINNGQWHHIAAVLNDDGSPSVNEILLYIDGVFQNTTANSTQLIGTVASQDVILGAYQSAGAATGYFNGMLDDICIYNRAIEIDEIFPEKKYPVSTQGLVARWRMDETGGMIAHDTVSHYDGLLNIAGWDFSPSWVDGDPQDWIISINGTDYPKLRWQVPSAYHGGSGTVDDPYQIADAHDILLLSESWWDWDKHFILSADIDMGGMNFTNAIIAMYSSISSNVPSWDAFNGTAFTGTFDGNGYTISNFTIHGGSNDYLGLFGYIGLTGQIKNLGLKNCTISGSSITGDFLPYCIGTLAGFNTGIISQCYTKGTVSGYYDVGGLVGCNSGEISNCYNKGSVAGYYNVGGLAGNNSSSNRIWPNVNSAGGNILMCYSTGIVSGRDNVGGLVGYNYQSSLPKPLPFSTYTGVILNSFWDIQASGMTKSAGGMGKTTVQMKTLSTFTSARWDFMGEIANGTEDIWFIRQGLEYPRFVWEDQLPIADAGDDFSVHCAQDGFAAVQLDGSGSSDADGDSLTYRWSWTIGQQSLAAEGIKPTIQLPVGAYEITLIVNDGIADSQADTVTITVYNTAPAADAGDDITTYLGFEGDTVNVMLDGSGSSDADGDTLTYKWYLGQMLLAEGVNPTVSLPVGVQAITLIVNDGIVNSLADEVTVNVIGPVEAYMWITPHVFSLGGQEKFVWALMNVPSGITLEQLDGDFGYYMLPGEVKAKWFWHIACGAPKVIARFEREQLRPYLNAGKNNLTFYGRLKDGRYIGGKYRIWVFNPPDKENGIK